MNENKSPEARSWHQIYRSPELTAKRRAKHIGKLRKTGLLASDAGGFLLDVCSGEGEMLDVLSSRAFDFLAGIDLESRKRCGPWYYAAARAQQLPFRENVFDWVLCAHALHHMQGIPHIERFLDEAMRCLKPGGKLVLIDHYNSMQLRLAFAVLRSSWARLTPWSEAFRDQLLAEHEELYDYLDHWKDLRRILLKNRLNTISYKQDLFFFYFTAEKSR